MSFRFIHTADLHLDAPLKAIALRDPALAHEVGTATRQAFTRIVDLCISEEADFLVIAGDLWDGKHSSTKTPRFLKQQLLRLRDAQIPVYIIRGNHDAMSTRTGELDLPENTHLFGDTASSVSAAFNGHRVAIHGLSFANAHAPTSLLPAYPPPQAGVFNLGIMHSSLGGSEGHDSYAPCSVTDLDGAGYDYWALGHIHKRAVYEGRATIVMPGNPQGRDIGESGDRSVTMVDVADDNSLSLTPLSVASLRFDHHPLDIGGISAWGDLLSRIEDALADAANAPRAEAHLVLRLRLTGATPLAYRIARDHDRLTDEARSFARHYGIWLDKLESSATPPQDDQRAAELPPELVHLVADILPDDPALMLQLTEMAEKFQSLLPDTLREELFGNSRATLEATCRDLMREGMPALIDRLTSEGQ